MAAHSVGGLLTQKYISGDHSLVEGAVLMGSTLTRGNRSINADGSTQFDFPVPTLSLGGTKDGLMRISRMAEAYYHGVENINGSQTDMFPVIAYEGISHMSYTSGLVPEHVHDLDLIPDVLEFEAHSIMSKDMLTFFKNVQFGT